MRTVVRTLIAVYLATAGLVLAAPAVRAAAVQQSSVRQSSGQQSSGTDAAGSHRLTIAIDGITPRYATPTSTITVSGTISNGTGSPLTGAQVQLLSSPQVFVTRSGMDGFTAGHDDGAAGAQEGVLLVLPGTLHSGSTAQWSASFTAASAGYSSFGVYPLAARAVYPDGTPAATVDRTLLPFWPGKGASNLPSTQLSVSWLWPLIDTPQQGMCGSTLATNSLAGSLRAGGRLDRLLTVGQQWAQQDKLTWVVDPALLSDAKLMTTGYEVGGSGDCSGRQHEGPSGAAARWLTALRQGTALEPLVVTPYADADVAALTRAGLYKNTQTAYRLGRQETSQVLGRTPSTALAWPAGGTASATVLTHLASDGGASTVVLDSRQLPSNDPQFDNALNATKTSKGTKMGVLLADSEITGLLGSASAHSPAATQFAAEQDYLAQTAMILAEGPNLQRSLVVAPPRRWDPSAGEAAALLQLTNIAPWLRQTDLSTQEAAAGQLPAQNRLPDLGPANGELSRNYTTEIALADSEATLYKELLYRPDKNAIDAAVAVTTSSAWRGAGAGAGTNALRMLTTNLNDNSQKVSIITGKKILLGGTSGNAPVSVQNLLGQAVIVKVVATPSDDSELTAGKPTLVIVQPGKTTTVPVSLHSSAITTTTMQLQLQTKDGSPLTWTTQTLSVQATRYGRALLVFIAAALGLLVLASMTRWIRRRLHDGRVDSAAHDTADSRTDSTADNRVEGRSGGTG